MFEPLDGSKQCFHDVLIGFCATFLIAMILTVLFLPVILDRIYGPGNPATPAIKPASQPIRLRTSTNPALELVIHSDKFGKFSHSIHTEYRIGDVVLLDHPHRLYVCNQRHTNHMPPNLNYWTLVAMEEKRRK
jgi:hypothetical protein